MKLRMTKRPIHLMFLFAAALTACASPAPTSVAPTAAPTERPAEVTASSTTEQPADTGSLTETTWMWTSFTNPVEQFEVENPENYTLTFQDDGTVSIKADCNNAGGSYMVDGQSIKITIGPMTLAACPPDSRSDDFVKYLGSAAIYFFQDGDLYIDLFADSGTLRFRAGSASSGNDTLSSLGVDVNAQPYSGTVYVGGGEDHWLNPTLISALGGTSEGPGVDASSLGDGCGFFIPRRPDVIVHWEQQEDIDTLRFFFMSLGDSSLAVVTPSGKVLCSDDLNPLVLDPYIEVDNPEPGAYAAFLGNYEGEALYPGFLVVTSQDMNPATMDLAQLFPRNIDPRGIPEVLSLDTLKPDSTDAATPPGGKLSEASLPFSAEYSAGGEIAAFNLDQPNSLCTGFISAAPTFSFAWSGNSDPVTVFFESNVDTTLLLQTPDGTFVCDDDFHGSLNINPGLTFTPANGKYHLWVGSFSPDIQAQGKLTITSDSAAAPAPLTSKDIQQ